MRAWLIVPLVAACGGGGFDAPTCDTGEVTVRLDVDGEVMEDSHGGGFESYAFINALGDSDGLLDITFIGGGEMHLQWEDLVANGEVDTNFSVGLFDFPMIDNTRLSNNQRAAVSLIALTPDVLSLKVAYFPSSRASLKDKPYYEEMTRQLVGGRQQPER